MAQWILLGLLALVVVGVIVLIIAMFTEMGTKRRSGAMKSTKTQHKARKK